MEAALNAKLDFKGSFSFKSSYSQAPNPALRLSDLGPIGLPLSAREAEVIKSRAEQEPFGMGDRTIVDKSVRDTWEMDAKMVDCISFTWLCLCVIDVVTFRLPLIIPTGTHGYPRWLGKSARPWALMLLRVFLDVSYTSCYYTRRDHSKLGKPA